VPSVSPLYVCPVSSSAYGFGSQGARSNKFLSVHPKHGWLQGRAPLADGSWKGSQGALPEANLESGEESLPAPRGGLETEQGQFCTMKLAEGSCPVHSGWRDIEL
jgi:hypothetical protein